MVKKFIDIYRNKNILVIGGSGSGKTRFFVKPSLMQMQSRYVVTDPKGQLLSEVGTMLRRGAPKLDENGKPMRDARGKVFMSRTASGPSTPSTSKRA